MRDEIFDILKTNYKRLSPRRILLTPVTLMSTIFIVSFESDHQGEDETAVQYTLTVGGVQASLY